MSDSGDRSDRFWEAYHEMWDKIPAHSGTLLAICTAEGYAEAEPAPATTEPAYSTGDPIRYPDAGKPYPERVDARLEAMEYQIAMALAAVERMQARANARIAELERQIEDWSAGR